MVQPAGPLWRQMPISRAFLYTPHGIPSGGAPNDYLSLKVPSKGALPPLQVTPLEPAMETDACFQAFFYASLYQEEKKNNLVPCPQSPASVPSSVPEPPVNQVSPWLSTGASGPQIQSSLDIKIAVQDHSKLYLGITSHPKSRLRLFKSTLSSCCAAPTEIDTPFPEPFIYALLHSKLSESPVRELSHETWRGKAFIIHDAPCGWKAYIKWGVACFPKGIIYNTTLIWRRRLWIALCGGIVLEEALDLSSDRLLNNNITTPVPFSLHHHTFHLGLGGPEPCYPVCVTVIPHWVSTSTPDTTGYRQPAHIRVTPSGNFLHAYIHLHITLKFGRWVGFMGDKLLVYYTMKASGQEEGTILYS